jgi:hypothetical protein
MKAGHPYETEELDLLRAEQRRILRQIPDWLFEANRDLVNRFDYQSVGDDRALVEFGLRRLAVAATEPVQALVDAWSRQVPLDRVTRFATHELDPGADVNFQAARRGIAELLMEEEKRVGRPARSVGTQFVPSLNVLITTLGTADLLATDGYRDPRFAD